MNKAMLIGNLGADPEVRSTAGGATVANIRIATSERWTDRQTGERRERTEWHRVTLWNKLADVANQYLRKGDKVFIEGTIQTRKWQDQSGNDRYTTEIQGRNLEMLGSPQGRREEPQQDRTGDYGYQTRGDSPSSAGPADDFDDDIPF